MPSSQKADWSLKGKRELAPVTDFMWSLAGFVGISTQERPLINSRNVEDHTELR